MFSSAGIVFMERPDVGPAANVRVGGRLVDIMFNQAYIARDDQETLRAGLGVGGRLPWNRPKVVILRRRRW